MTLAKNKKPRRIGLIALGISAAGVFVLSYVGYRQYFPAPNAWKTSDYIYEAFRNFWMWSPQNPDKSTPLALTFARYLAPVVTVWAGFAAALSLFSDGALNLWQLFRARDHVVVCGAGGKGAALALRLSATKKVVVIERSGSAEGVVECRRRGLPVLIGDARDELLLRKAKVPKAHSLVAMFGNDGENAALVLDVLDIFGEQNPDLRVLAHIVNARMRNALSNSTAERDNPSHRRVRYFNIYDGASAQALNTRAGLEAALRGSPSPGVVVAGNGPLASLLPLHIAKRWQTLNGKDAAGKLEMVLLGPEAARLKRHLLTSYCGIGDICTFRAIDSEFLTKADVDTLRQEGTSLVAGYVAGTDETSVATCSLALAESLPDAALTACVYTQESALIHLLDSAHLTCSDRMSAFSVLDGLLDPEMLYGGRRESLARQIHSCYVEDERRNGVSPSENKSMVGWDRLGEDDREQNRDQADDMLRKLDLLGVNVVPLSDWDEELFSFTPTELDRLARDEHDRWWNLKKAQGWTYGAEKNGELKTHPDMQPYDRLSAATQDKDVNAVARIPQVLAFAGYRARRRR